MVSSLLTRYVIVAFVAQIALSIINSLFVLSSNDAFLVLVGFFGLVQRVPSVLLFFVAAQSLSLAMDVVRLVLWSDYILNSVMLVPGTLGTFFLVLQIFQTVVKAVGVVFCLLIRRQIVEWLKDPRLSSTLTRQGAFSFMPDFLQAHGAGETLLPPSTPTKKSRASPRLDRRGSGGPVSIGETAGSEDYSSGSERAGGGGGGGGEGRGIGTPLSSESSSYRSFM